jgi:hypothetical protein
MKLKTKRDRLFNTFSYQLEDNMWRFYNIGKKIEINLATKNPKNKKFAKKMKKKTEKTPPLPSLFPSTMADLGHRYSILKVLVQKG